MRRLFLLLGILVFFTGCAHVAGSINAATYTEPPQKPLFIVMIPDPLSLADRNIGMMIEKKMIEHGYSKAPSEAEANVAVMFKYDVGSGITKVTGGVYQGTGSVHSYTVYPRFFQITIVDLLKSKPPEKLTMIWQGELTSKGRLDEISRLAPYFVDTLFEYYGSTVTNEQFYKRLERTSCCLSRAQTPYGNE